MVDYDKLLFSTAYPIDKVVATGTNSFAVSGPSGAYYYNSHHVQTNTIPNPYGKRGFIRYAWSLDGVNYYSQDTLLEFEFHIDAHLIGGPSDSGPINGVKATTAMGSTDALIAFVSYNGLHGNVTYTAGNDSFTGVALTFYYKWALFEKDV